MSFDFVAAETALVTWVRTATGIALGYVRLADQSGVSMDELGEQAYATLQFARLTTSGLSDEMVYLDHSGDLIPPPMGQELEAKVLAYGLLSVSLMIYTPKAVGPTSAMALTFQAQRALSLPSVHAALSNAGMSVSDYGQPVNSSTVLDKRWRGRGMLQPTFNVTDDLSERMTYIAEVSGQATVNGGAPKPFDVDLP